MKNAMVFSKVFLAICSTLFLAKTSNAESSTTVDKFTVACNTADIVITLSGATATYASVQSSDTTCSPSGGTNLITGSGPWTIPLTSAAVSCWTSGSTSYSGPSITLDETITLKGINFKVNALFDQIDDLSLTGSCAYTISETSKSVTGASSFTVTPLVKPVVTEDLDILVNEVDLTFIKKDDGSAAGTVAIDSETSKICVVARVANPADTNVQDFNIKTLTFKKDASATGDDASEYITNYCPNDDTASVKDFVEAVTAHTTACGATSADQYTNCNLQRSLCFKPFAFTGSNTLVVDVVIVPSYTSGFNSFVTCSSGAIGRKRRETDLDEIKLSAMLSIVRGVAGEQLMQSCKTTEYMIAAVVCAAGFILSTIVAVFSFCLNNQARIKPYA